MMPQFDVYKQVIESQNWLALWPELSLVFIGLILLVADLFLKSEQKGILGKLAFWSQVLLLVVFTKWELFVPDFMNQDVSSFNGMILQNWAINWERFFFLLTGILTTHAAGVFFKRHGHLPKMEYINILMWTTAAFMLLVQSQHFIMFFLALETVTVGFYVLVSFRRDSAFSLEAGLKYLITAAFSSGILLFGIVLLYGAAGNPALIGSTADPLNFSGLKGFLEYNPDNLMAITGAILLICGIAFKIGAVPFHVWIPDVYQGAPTPTTVFLGVASKAAGFFVLINLIQGPLTELSYILLPLFAALAMISILLGNLTAISQRHVKRILGLSGIVHAGFILMGVVAMMSGVSLAYTAILFYLFAYLFASFLVAEVLVYLGASDDGDIQIEDFHELYQERPLLAGLLILGLGSLAGMPPLAGFIGKFLIFVAVFQAKQYALLAVAIMGVVLSIYYYFGWMRAAVFKPEMGERYETGRDKVDGHLMPDFASRILLAFLAIVTVVLGFYTGI